MKKWFEQKERAGFGYALMFFVLKVFPAAFMRFLAYIIGFFYWIFDKNARKFSADYYGRLKAFSAQKTDVPVRKKLPGSAAAFSLGHVCSFALALVEIVQCWAGKFSFRNVNWQNDDVHDLVQNINAGKGTVIVMSHLGNAQMMRGLASFGEAGTEQKMSVTTITDLKQTGGFTSLLKKINPDSHFHIIQADDFGIDTALLIQERLESGEVVVVAGDRTGVHSERFIPVSFLGGTANLPYGVFLLIAVLNVPVYFVNGVRRRDFCLNPQYDMFVMKNPVPFDCPRKEREQRIVRAAEKYAENLEKLCMEHPYQWYNFYDFWEK